MRTRTTLILFLIAALIGGVIVKMDRLMPSTRDRQAHEDNPLPFDAAKVDAIDISAGEASTTLTLVDRVWHVGKPIGDLADATRVQAVIDSLQKAEWLERLSKPELSESAWKLTGLDKPFAHVKFTNAGKVLAECWLGNASAIEGACYLSIPATNRHEQSESYVVHTPLLQLLKKPMEDWRDSQLVHVPAESVAQLLISDGHGQIEVARDKPKSPWNLIKPLQTRGHNERINELLSSLLALKITAATAGESAKAPVQDAMHITVYSTAAPRPIEVILAPPADPQAGKTQATTSQRAPTFTVASDRLPGLWVELNDLRDDKLARVDTEKVDAVMVKSLLNSDVTLRKQEDSWQLQRSDGWEPANGDRVAKMFEALNNHQVREFVADSAANLEPYGLNAPFLTVAWNEHDEKPDTGAPKTANKRFGALGVVGTEYELQFGQDPQGNVFAKYEGEPIVYRVGASILQALPRDNVRWKALNPVRFSQFALLRIGLTVGTNPTVLLEHHPITSAWKGSRAGEDLTPFIDQVKADHLVDKLGGLVVQDWVQDRTEGSRALQLPAITIQVTLLTEPGKMDSPTKLITINFAPTVAGTDSALYYGRVDSSPDIFLLTREGLGELLSSVLKDK